MRAIAKRVRALEAWNGGRSGVSFWLRIIGRTEAEARSDYEAANGPIPEQAGVIFRKIVSPSRDD